MKQASDCKKLSPQTSHRPRQKKCARHARQSRQHLAAEAGLEIAVSTMKWSSWRVGFCNGTSCGCPGSKSKVPRLAPEHAPHFLRKHLIADHNDMLKMWKLIGWAHLPRFCCPPFSLCPSLCGGFLVELAGQPDCKKLGQLGLFGGTCQTTRDCH